ncbi:MAG TPA: GreA/GreB family elongation factor [Rectinemataceae bacterium]
MSRAFVDEDAGRDETQGLHEIPLPLAPGARNYMTPEGAAALLRELAFLSEIERPKAAAALASSGQAAESDALRRISELDRRISYLLRMKALLEIVDPPASKERVVFGLAVRVADESGEEAEYRIVGAYESDPERGLVSWASPIARALLGKRAGDIAVVKLPRCEKKLRLLEIK